MILIYREVHRDKQKKSNETAPLVSQTQIYRDGATIDTIPSSNYRDPVIKDDAINITCYVLSFVRTSSTSG